MDMLPSSLVVMQQGRFEGIRPARMRDTPLLAYSVELNREVLAGHIDMRPAVEADKTLGIGRKTMIPHCFLLIVLQVFIPQSRSTIIATDRLKSFKVLTGGCTQTARRCFCSSHPDHHSSIDRQVRSDIEQMLAGMVNIALGPVFHAFIDLLEHVSYGHRQHQVAKNRHKQCRYVYQ